jgi:hypothetical protein
MTDHPITLSQAQRDLLATISDSYRRDVLRRVMDRAANPRAAVDPRCSPVLDPEAEAIRQRWQPIIKKT